MNTRKHLMLLACILPICAASQAESLEYQLLACTMDALKINAALTSEPNEAISQALAECHQIHADYAQDWLNNLQALGFSSTKHINALVSAHSYRTALTYLNQSYTSIKHENDLDT
ncbi:hypothetical protein QWY82_05640 [Simiduia curdlanivorans]|uniref:Uncharacterized protein n=1 Tax=Simiduia curdlanivorans TaxID=1492769 RepID=A0ABV8V5E8_9GAMM|nr:hypothetical protein [Simiduia curdlanivorans]MDN3638294.1 hypothetical protein [Simiduia curdlanivorans]